MSNPNSLKHAEVVPVSKNGKKNDVNSYRTISHLSPFLKFLSHQCLRNRVVTFFQVIYCTANNMGLEKIVGVNQIIKELIKAGEKNGKLFCVVGSC